MKIHTHQLFHGPEVSFDGNSLEILGSSFDLEGMASLRDFLDKALNASYGFKSIGGTAIGADSDPSYGPMLELIKYLECRFAEECEIDGYQYHTETASVYCADVDNDIVFFEDEIELEYEKEPTFEDEQGRYD
jgi:hypothetical protein